MTTPPCAACVLRCTAVGRGEGGHDGGTAAEAARRSRLGGWRKGGKVQRQPTPPVTDVVLPTETGGACTMQHAHICRCNMPIYIDATCQRTQALARAHARTGSGQQGTGRHPPALLRRRRREGRAAGGAVLPAATRLSAATGRWPRPVPSGTHSTRAAAAGGRRAVARRCTPSGRGVVSARAHGMLVACRNGACCPLHATGSSTLHVERCTREHMLRLACAARCNRGAAPPAPASTGQAKQTSRRGRAVRLPS
jgi:hypothetical protein